MRQHSLVFCLALVKNRLTKTAKHLSRRKFCANLLDIDAAWRGAVVLSRKYGFYLLICLHTALKMLEIHVLFANLFAYCVKNARNTRRYFSAFCLVCKQISKI